MKETTTKEKKSVTTKKPRVRSAKVTRAEAAPAHQGSKGENEKAILISLAYLIGFLTAYIAFSLNGGTTVEHQRLAEHRPYALAGSEQVAAASGRVGIHNDDEGLFVVNHGRERIISAKMNASEYEPGFHRGIASTAVSGDDNFVHYCAMMTVSDDQCSHFVYVVDEDKVYRVSHAGAPLITSTNEAMNAAWSDINLLSVGDRVSVNAATPWILE